MLKKTKGNEKRNFMRSKVTMFVVCILIIGLIPVSVFADVVEITPEADAYVNISSPDTYYGSWAFTYVGTPVTTPDTKRGLQRFNLSAIPAGSIINSAAVYLFGRADGVLSRVDIGIFPNIGPWNEGTVIWNNKPGYGVMQSHTIVGTAGGDFYRTWDLTALTSAWYNGIWANNGVMYSGLPSTGGGSATFSSKEHPTVSERPKLIVDYTPPGGSSDEEEVEADTTRTKNICQRHQCTQKRKQKNSYC